MAKRIIRGLRDVRTISGSIDDRSVPFRAYMKLSVLEMEKFRRGKERLSAIAKLRDIDERFKDIDAEKREILAAMDASGGNLVRAGEPGRRTAPTRSGAGSFKIRY